MIIDIDNEEFEVFSLYLQEGLDFLNLSLEKAVIAKLYKFYLKLAEANKYMNLTAITKLKEVVFKHFIDSLSIIRVMPELKFEKISIIDIGTGAGFPALPLALAFPQCQIAAVDSLNKRIRFINEVKKELNLDNLNAYHGRAEEYAFKTEFREQFDLTVSRAVANLSTLSEYCLPFIHIDSTFIAYKSDKCGEELEKSRTALSILGGAVELTDSFILPYEKAGRSLIKIRKEKAVPKKYPRKSGTALKSPL